MLTIENISVNYGAIEALTGISMRVEQGEARKPDLRLRLSYQDWVDIVGERLDPVRAVATGRLRPRGNPLAFARLRRVFPRD